MSVDTLPLHIKSDPTHCRQIPNLISHMLDWELLTPQTSPVGTTFEQQQRTLPCQESQGSDLAAFMLGLLQRGQSINRLDAPYNPYIIPI